MYTESFILGAGKLQMGKSKVTLNPSKLDVLFVHQDSAIAPLWRGCATTEGAGPSLGNPSEFLDPAQ